MSKWDMGHGGWHSGLLVGSHYEAVMTMNAHYQKLVPLMRNCHQKLVPYAWILNL